ncbi:HERV-H LTR-associating protein 2 isoform X2 [Osmerus eperlanus]|uniref:HERV-H LTR-associating protein 2 isoform X2 n=1 Tax=Osmerus eperlanus TaxID=29151 RepID=UPI002E142EE0
MAWNMASIMVVVTYSMVSMVMRSQTVKGTDVPVVCEFSETCVLPCSFQVGKDLVLHWMFSPDGDPTRTAHTYYSNSNQLSLQDQWFRSRTSLFDEQLSRGNASLRLTEVKVQDQGRYKCYTSIIRGTQEHFIKLTVEAPVRSVDIKLSDDVLTCSSRAIYPLPKLTWSTSPPLVNQPPLSSETNTQGLYNINSSLRIMGNNSDIDFVCNVSSNTQTRTARLRKQAPIEGSPSSSVSIFCSLPKSPSDPLTFDLEWRFNHSELILTLSSEKAEPQVQGTWKDQVESSPEPGRLRLRKLTLSHQGTYTCDLRSAGNRYMSVTDLQILPEGETEYLAGKSNWWIVVLVIPLLAGLGFLVYLKKKAKYPSGSSTGRATKNKGSPKKMLNPGQQTSQQGDSDADSETLGPLKEDMSNGRAEMPVEGYNVTNQVL